MKDQRRVKCGTHGDVLPAFVCGHLVRSAEAPLGFNEAELDADDPEPQAWCDRCDQMLTLNDGWNEETEAFANIRLVCEFCFARLRERHRHDGSPPKQPA